MEKDSFPQFGTTGRKLVYDENGKPCRTCNTLLDFQLATGKITATEANTSLVNKTTNNNSYRDDPPDVEQLGRSSWTLLHSIASKYPVTPSTEEQLDMKNFINIFSKIYPCNWCAADFRNYIATNAPKVGSREELGKWFCEAHNEVNEKLGKAKFDCNLWEKRWKDGWD
ncbi:probable Mitochondrial FAD-linked sulfhydryl oxidase ERV1 [Saccharomycodes ludwigii]|uniref:Sulfhydryl oxidase n=1 Tax=Saccharomycodes ludwigii TaxID=36035 RepID=A0A376B3M8_9ASCO|nr:hypothetical protein SCDLUD_000638 [Saccharomycodes ludwigii]KAH3903030.1 hypothetical protein SCDLUD_000638 [Saccharomycodes ludwigii]SSD59295.1 probable Mitochondrial FAD-linked sulfhydryl oxidase ERV1 [Saccharomycodes ludwigii]